MPENPQEATLFLIPTTLGNSTLHDVLPQNIFDIVSSTKYFIVENLRTARRFLKAINKAIDIDTLHFELLNKYTDQNQIETFLSPLKSGNNIGILSEAGCPAIADPGADVVALAQENGVKVVPLVGPSSILLSLMASGFNGQNFTFHGYLPINDNERNRAIKQMENSVRKQHQTQIFIETPYRNNKLVENIIAQASPSTKLCIAADLTLSTEFVQTKSLREWKKNSPNLNKRPTIFLLGN